MSLEEISLFSGIGGISLAAQWAGIHPIQFCEIDPYCQKVLAKNFPGVPIENDVTKFDGTRFRGRNTILTAGFPCQPHSVAGSRKASGDDRDLWSEVVRVLSETQSRWFLGENVPGLLSSESGRFFGRVVNDLESLGYRVGWTVYGASDVGASHRRHRIFIVAYSDRPRLEGRGRPGQLPTVLLPTPRANPAMAAGLNPDPKHFPNLETVIARYALLPTPTASDGTTGAILGANDQFVTLKSGAMRKINQNGTDGSLGLARTMMLATPAAADCQGSHGGGQGKSLRTDIHQYRAETGERGTLNPSFVGRMMGFPDQWLEID